MRVIRVTETRAKAGIAAITAMAAGRQATQVPSRRRFVAPADSFLVPRFADRYRDPSVRSARRSTTRKSSEAGIIETGEGGSISTPTAPRRRKAAESAITLDYNLRLSETPRGCRSF